MRYSSHYRSISGNKPSLVSLAAHVFCIWYLVFRMGAKSGFELARINLDPQHYPGRARRSRSVCPGGRTGMPAPPPHVRLLSSMPNSADHSALRGQPMLHRRRSRRRFLQKAAPHPVSSSPTFTTASQSSRRCPSTACSLGIVSPTFSPRPARSTPRQRHGSSSLFFGRHFNFN